MRFASALIRPAATRKGIELMGSAEAQNCSDLLRHSLATPRKAPRRQGMAKQGIRPRGRCSQENGCGKASECGGKARRSCVCNGNALMSEPMQGHSPELICLGNARTCRAKEKQRAGRRAKAKRCEAQRRHCAGLIRKGIEGKSRANAKRRCERESIGTAWIRSDQQGRRLAPRRQGKEKQRAISQRQG